MGTDLSMCEWLNFFYTYSKYCSPYRMYLVTDSILCNDEGNLVPLYVLKAYGGVEV